MKASERLLRGSYMLKLELASVISSVLLLYVEEETGKK